MSKVKILVVEDEVIIADNLCDTLEKLGYDVLEPAINYTEALATIHENTPDLAILDIQLSGKKTGIDIAEEINKNYGFPFIFLTSNADATTINEAKKVNPPAYLIKPFTKDDLFSAIEIAIYNHAAKIGTGNKQTNSIIKDSLFVKDQGVFKKVKYKDILYIKSDHVYVEITMVTKKVLVIRTSLNDILTKLSDTFLRVHRSYIVNTNYLTAIDSASLNINNEIIPIGKKYKEDILQKINLV